MEDDIGNEDDDLVTGIKKILEYAVKEYVRKGDETSRDVAIAYLRKYMSFPETKGITEKFADGWLSEELRKCGGKPLAESRAFYDAARIVKESGMAAIADSYVIKKATEVPIKCTTQ